MRLHFSITRRLSPIAQDAAASPRRDAVDIRVWRYHGGTYSLRKAGYDAVIMRAVALAYRRERQAGRLDEPARGPGPSVEVNEDADEALIGCG